MLLYIYINIHQAIFNYENITIKKPKNKNNTFTLKKKSRLSTQAKGETRILILNS